jgi:hypothetical protein
MRGLMAQPHDEARAAGIVVRMAVCRITIHL